MPVVSVRQMAAAAWTLLDDHPTLTVYRSVVEPKPPTDSNGVTKAYAVFHPFPGDDTPNDLRITPGQLMWQFQVSCAGGNHDYVLGAVDVVRDIFIGKSLTVAGVKVGLIRPPLGYQPPAPKPQPVDSGQRLQVPLLYQVLAVPA